MRVTRLTPTALLVGACALAIAACGSSNNGGGGGGGGATPSIGGLADVAHKPDTQKKGGTLNVVSAEAWEHLDPGASYFQIDYLVIYAVHRPLVGYNPDSQKVQQPDLAASMPIVSKDGKTVTVKIKPNIKFSPPVNRTVTSADVKYAIERAFNPNVQNAYYTSYFNVIKGADKAKGGPIPGITTPDKTTIVFHLTKNFGATFAQTLSLPASAPVPKEYAQKFDQSSPSKYDTDPTIQAFTGPYMIKTYQAGRKVVLVRNPNWDPKTDNRPAYADKIVWRGGGDPAVLARQVLNSPNLLMADVPPASLLKRAYTTKKSQLTINPLGSYYVSLDTAKKPFSNVNLRKAVAAITDRQAYSLARGGRLVAPVANHFLPPEAAGFDQAGGEKGFGFDYLANPQGDINVAKKYMKLAGYPGGKYTGHETVRIVGSNADPGPKEMAIVQDGLRKLGFKTSIKAVPQQTMYSKFCGYVKAGIEVCPTAGWIPDYLDPSAYLIVPFNGAAIVPINNSNWAQFDDPQVNAAINKAAAITDQNARLKAWADIDRMITSKVPAVPAVWSANAELKGTQVHGVIDIWNNDWNLSYSSPR